MSVKAVLYYSPKSPWSSAVRLAIYEKGYDAEELDLKQVDITKGENFSPSFLRLSPAGLVPCLIVPYEKTLSDDIESRFKAVTDPKAIVEFLDKSRSARSKTHTVSSAPAPSLAPATVEFSNACASIVDTVHSEEVTPHLLSYHNAHDQSSLKNLAKELLPEVTDTKSTLSKYIADAEGDVIHVSSKVKALWTTQLEETERFSRLFSKASNTTPDDEISEYFKFSNLLWAEKVKALLVRIDKEISGPFTLGEQISIADIHLAAWLEHLLRLSGVAPTDSAVDSVAKVERHIAKDFQLPKTFSSTDVEEQKGEATVKRSKLTAFLEEMKSRKSWEVTFGQDQV